MGYSPYSHRRHHRDDRDDNYYSSRHNHYNNSKRSPSYKKHHNKYNRSRSRSRNHHYNNSSNHHRSHHHHHSSYTPHSNKYSSRSHREPYHKSYRDRDNYNSNNYHNSHNNNGYIDQYNRQDRRNNYNSYEKNGNNNNGHRNKYSEEKREQNSKQNEVKDSNISSSNNNIKCNNVNGMNFMENSLRKQNFDKQFRSKTKSKSNRNNNNNNNNNKQYKKKSYSPSKRSSSSSGSSSMPSHSDSKDRSKDAGHYKHEVGTKLYSKQHKYKILQHISDGTFGRVLECRNYSDDKLYAIKVIRAVDRYIDSAKTETEIIEKIQKKESKHQDQIVQLKETFYLDNKKNFAMVFEKLGPSLYDVIKKNHYKGFPLAVVQDFFKYILQAIGFLHSCKLTHTDLKPENILLKYPDLMKIYPNKKYREKYQYVPHENTGNKIKIIDFGGATFADDHHSSIINTRQYRAPEVILQCCQWSEISDVWSVGCIVMELITGELFYQTHENYEHLAMIEKSSGKIPYWMSKYAQEKDEWFTGENYEFNWPKKASSKESIRRVEKMETLSALEDADLRDLLERCLTIDPRERISCEKALQHYFFTKKYTLEP